MLYGRMGFIKALAGAAGSLWIPGCADRILAPDPYESRGMSHDYREYISRRIRDVQNRDGGAAREMIGYGKANATSFFKEQRAAKPSAVKEMSIEVEVFDPYKQQPVPNAEVNVLGQGFRTESDGVTRISGIGLAKPTRETPVLIIPGGDEFYSVVDNPENGHHRYPLLEFYQENGVDIVTAMKNLGTGRDDNIYPVKVYIQPEIVKELGEDVNTMITEPTGRFINDSLIRLVGDGVQAWQDAVDGIAQKTGGPRKLVAEFVDDPEWADYHFMFLANSIHVDTWEYRDGKTRMFVNIDAPSLGTAMHITGHGLFGYQHDIAPNIQSNGIMGSGRSISEMEARITYVGGRLLSEWGTTDPIYNLKTDTYEPLTETPSDFDKSGDVNFDDFFLFADAFGTDSHDFDLDNDGTVGFGDFFIFADNFGRTTSYQAFMSRTSDNYR